MIRSRQCHFNRGRPNGFFLGLRTTSSPMSAREVSLAPFHTRTIRFSLWFESSTYQLHSWLALARPYLAKANSTPVSCARHGCLPSSRRRAPRSIMIPCICDDLASKERGVTDIDSGTVTAIHSRFHCLIASMSARQAGWMFFATT